MEIAIIGSGSHFALNLIRAVFQARESRPVHFRLMDINSAASERVAAVVAGLNRLTGAGHSTSVHPDRKTAIAGADHVLCSFAVDFPDSFLRTCWVMQDHGLDFVEGETATPGALLATLRHLPPLLEIAKQMEVGCPSGWLHIINNPMPRLVLGLKRGLGFRRVLGHCHGTLHVRRGIAKIVEVPREEIDIFVAGINHFHVVQKLVDRRDGRDLLAELHSLSDEADRRWQKQDYTQWKMFRECGDLIGHGIWHNYDYLPFANRRVWKDANYNTWPRAALAVQARRDAHMAEGAAALNSVPDLEAFLAEREEEQVFSIMAALSGMSPDYEYLSGNWDNDGKLPFLPPDAIVELPSTVTRDDIRLHSPTTPVPAYFRVWLQIQAAIHDRSVAAVLGRDRGAAIEAIMLDPVFRDCDCSPEQLLDEMLEVNAGLVPALA